MHIIKNIQNFLLDQDYYIDIFNNFIHVYDYQELITLTDKLIELKLKEFKLIIEGKELSISNMDNKEILIKGVLDSLRFVRWNIMLELELKQIKKVIYF